MQKGYDQMKKRMIFKKAAHASTTNTQHTAHGKTRVKDFEHWIIPWTILYFPPLA